MTNKIIIEALGTHQTGGGRTAIRTLLEHIFRLDQTTLFFVLSNQYEPLWARYPNVQQHVIQEMGRFYARLRLQCRLPILVRREQAGLVHFTKNLGVWGLTCPYIVTVHDLTTLYLASQHSWLDVLYWKLIEPVTIRKAAQVVVVSYDTARDVQKFYGVPQEKIEVVYWAPHERFKPLSDPAQLDDLRQRYRLPNQYILFVGILAKKK
ncbi:MAG: glycosyltransferase, partial [Anaerolineae bacterium]|nr:glycosyltransferase [Anaerolineae bacterium]